MITCPRFLCVPNVAEGEGTLTGVDHFVHQLLGLEPIVETSQQTENGAVVSEVALPQIVQETGSSEKHLDDSIALWIIGPD